MRQLFFTCIAAVAMLTAGATGGTPPNDACQSAASITGTGPFPFDNTEATTDGPAQLACAQQVFNTGPFIGRDIWYCWTAPCDGSVTIDTCGGTTVDTKLAVYDGCQCPTDDANLLVCDNDSCVFQSTVTFAAVSGQNYLIQLGTPPLSNGSPLGGGTGTFRIECADEPDPPCGQNSANCRLRDTWNAVASDGTGTRIADDFRPMSNGSITQLCWWGGYFDGLADCAQGAADNFTIRYFANDQGQPGSLLAEFHQSNGTLTVLGPERTYRSLMGILDEFEYSATHSAVAVQSNTCYWVEITNELADACAWHWETARTRNGRAFVDGRLTVHPDGYAVDDGIDEDFSICMGIALNASASCAGTPSNDLCANRQTANDGITYFDTSGAATDGSALPACDFPLADEQVHRDVWFQHTSTCSGNLRFSLCESSYDTKLAVYEGSQCPTVNEPADYCNDNQCGSGRSLQSMVVVPALAGESFIIRVGGFGDTVQTGPTGLGGPAAIDIRCFPAPVADHCESAISQTLPYMWTGSNLLASADCSSFEGGDVWAAFQVNAPSAVSLEYSAAGPVFDDAWRGLMTSCECSSSLPANHVTTKDIYAIHLIWDCLPTGTYYYPIVADPDAEGQYTLAAASSSCTSVCQNGTGECCAETDSLGCNDFTCCEVVCRLDNYCCNTAWDDLCVNRASALCSTCPGNACEVATDECIVPHDEPGCNDLAVCSAICTCNPFCCLLGWNEDCASCGIDDFDCDGITKRRDYKYFNRCHAGPCANETCTLPLEIPVANILVCCPLGDADTDADVDLRDFAELQNTYDQL